MHLPRNVFLRLAVLVLGLLPPGLALAQRPAHYEHTDADLVHARELFDMAKYGAAQYECERVIDRIRDPHSAIRTEAEFYSAICAVRLFHDDASHRLATFIDRHPESFRVPAINLELFRHAFNQKRWGEAIAFADKVDRSLLSTADQDEYSFKRGYALFQDGRVDAALVEFARIKDGSSVYASSATYYAAHINYTRKNYETALAGFEKLKDDPSFGRVVPYYIAQIQFLQGKYDALLEYTK
ncbi:MAG: hypothetical protein JNM91_08630, partial [Flavobacteriales bacterium]|nr:hypothetical protein [Flavobacteriales bacterium]